MAKFFINVSVNQQQHEIRLFDVPDEVLVGTKDYDQVVEKAGHYYMNHIDLMSCTGDYRWSVFPVSLMVNVKEVS